MKPDAKVIEVPEYPDSCIRCKAYDICKYREHLQEGVRPFKTEKAIKGLCEYVADNCRNYERDESVC